MKYYKVEAIRIRIHDGPLLMSAQKDQLETEIKKAIKYDCDISIDNTEQDIKPVDQSSVKPSIIKMAKVKLLKKRYKLTIERL